jgi:hypothetical protein
MFCDKPVYNEAKVATAFYTRGKTLNNCICCLIAWCVIYSTRRMIHLSNSNVIHPSSSLHKKKEK